MGWNSVKIQRRPKNNDNNEIQWKFKGELKNNDNEEIQWKFKGNNKTMIINILLSWNLQWIKSVSSAASVVEKPADMIFEPSLLHSLQKKIKNNVIIVQRNKEKSLSHRLQEKNQNIALITLKFR